MKRNLVLLSVAAALSLIAGLAFAGSRVVMRVSVPFEFYLEDQLLPAGEYQFETGYGNETITSSLILVRSSDGRGIRLFITQPRIETGATTDYLRFNQYGEKHFLSDVSICGHIRTLKMLKLEKELRSRLEGDQDTTIIAQK